MMRALLVGVFVAIGVVPAAGAESPAPPRLPIKVLVGPFRSLDAYCAQVKAETIDDEAGHNVTCDFTRGHIVDAGPTVLAQPAAPVLAAKLFVAEALDPHCQLAIRTRAGWYVLENGVRCLGARAKSDLSSRMLDFSLAQVFPSQPAVLRLRVAYKQSDEDYDGSSFSRLAFETIVYCGIGTSGAPSCTRELVVSGAVESHQEGKVTHKSRLALKLTPGAGTLTVEGDTATERRYLTKPLKAGTYEVKFP